MDFKYRFSVVKFVFMANKLEWNARVVGCCATKRETSSVIWRAGNNCDQFKNPIIFMDWIFFYWIRCKFNAYNSLSSATLDTSIVVAEIM